MMPAATAKLERRDEDEAADALQMASRAQKELDGRFRCKECGNSFASR